MSTWRVKKHWPYTAYKNKVKFNYSQFKKALEKQTETIEKYVEGITSSGIEIFRILWQRIINKIFISGRMLNPRIMNELKIWMITTKN